MTAPSGPHPTRHWPRARLARRRLARRPDLDADTARPAVPGGRAGASSRCRSARRARSRSSSTRRSATAAARTPNVGTGGREWRTCPRGTVHAATLMHRREPGLIHADRALPDRRRRAGERTPPGHDDRRRRRRQTPAIGTPVASASATVGGVTLPAARLLEPSPPIGHTDWRYSHDDHRPGPPAAVPAGSRPATSRALVQPDRVHGSVYTSPAVFDLRDGPHLREGWVYVAHESEVPEPGDYLTRRIGRRPDRRRARQGRRGPGAAQPLHPPRQQAVQRREGQRQLVPLPVPRLDVQQRRQPARAFRCATATARRSTQVRSELGLAQAPRVDSYGGFVFASLAPRASRCSSTSATRRTPSTGC